MTRRRPLPCGGRARPPDRWRRTQPSVTVDRSALDRLFAEECLEDLQRGRRSRVAAVAAVLDQRADNEPGIVRRPVAAPPRLVEDARVTVTRVERLLRGSGLPRDRDREATEDRGRGAERPRASRSSATGVRRE